MPSGTLELLLASAQGLKSADFFSKTDPYAVITCGNQCQKSNVARNQGANPKWNQKFVFMVNEDVSEVSMKIMDEDMLTADDELGTVTVPLSTVFQVGQTPTTSYNVVQKNGKFKGEVKVSLSFTPKPESFHHTGNYTAQHSHGPSRFSQSSSKMQGPYGSGGGGGGWSQGSY